MREPRPQADCPTAPRPSRATPSSGEGLDGGAEGADVAYYLDPLDGRGKGGGFADRDEQAATNFAPPARAPAWSAIVYLGGLPSNNGAGLRAPALAARTTAKALASGARRSRTPARRWCSAAAPRRSRCSSALVHRLPLMIAPKWVETRSQPIAIADVVAALAALGEREDVTGDVHLGGADVLTYREMMQRWPRSGPAAPRTVGVPVLHPASVLLLGVAVHARRDGALVRPLVDGLRSEMIVQQPPPPGHQRRPDGLRRRRAGGAGASDREPGLAALAALIAGIAGLVRWRRNANGAGAHRRRSSSTGGRHGTDDDGAVRSVQAAAPDPPEGRRSTRSGTRTTSSAWPARTGAS